MKSLELNQMGVVDLTSQEVMDVDGGERSARTWAIEAGVFLLFGVVGVIAFEVGYSH